MESKFWADNRFVAGVDEAGRGALAGPVVAAAVILPMGDMIDGAINDSKLLTPAKREELFEKIISGSLCYGIGLVDNIRIDSINILQATVEAMHIAIAGLDPKPEHLLIDGNYYRNSIIPFTTVVRGDSASISIAAASILAKVTRDRWMKENAHINYPVYYFDQHKGYGTKKHYQSIDTFGACPLHRKTFLKKYYLAADTLFG